MDFYLKLHFTLGVFKRSFFFRKILHCVKFKPQKKKILKNSRFNDPIIFSYFRVACFKNSHILQLCKIKEYFCMCELKTANYETFAIFKYFCPFSPFNTSRWHCNSSKGKSLSYYFCKVFFICFPNHN